MRSSALEGDDCHVGPPPPHYNAKQLYHEAALSEVMNAEIIYVGKLLKELAPKPNERSKISEPGRTKVETCQVCAPLPEDDGLAAPNFNLGAVLLSTKPALLKL